MKNIKLYINKQLADLYSTPNINLNKQISDFTDLSSRDGDFSYSIKLPITKTNQNIFGFINLLTTASKFNRTSNYNCQLYCNDNLLIDGVFILREITEAYFEGNITNKVSGDIFSLLGDKSLRDLKLPEIDFEGLMLPVDNIGNLFLGRYETLTNDALNPALGFDFPSLVAGQKTATNGKNGSSLDLREYYYVPMVSYSNFYTDKNINQLNTLTNNLSLDNFLPVTRLTKVLEQLFKDIGYTYELQNSLLNDPNIGIPYTGSEPPTWNWKQLSRMYVFTDTNGSALQAIQRDLTNAGTYRQFTVKPFISSRTNSIRSQTLNSATYKQFTDSMNFSGLGMNDTANYNYGALNASESNDFKVHFMPTNGLKYDFNNNFSFYSPAPRNGENRGWLYSCNCDGTYEFEVEIAHDIRTYSYARFFQYFPLNTGYNNTYTLIQDSKMLRIDPNKPTYGNALGYEGTAEFNKTWNYTCNEPFYMGNMVAFVKENEFDVDSFIENYANEFDFPTYSNKKNYYNYKSGLKFRNMVSDNSLLAFYRPMVRDLYHGNFSPSQKWENYIQSTGSILKHSDVIPPSQDENVTTKYFGFNSQTQILEYDNKISYDPSSIGTYNGWVEDSNDIYPVSEQLKRKLVRLKRKQMNGTGYLTDPNLLIEQDVITNAPTVEAGIYEAQANGIVKYKFRTQLKKGDQIRLYYFTSNNWKKVIETNNFNETFPPVTGSIFNQFMGNNYNSSMRYNDAYFDECKINKYTVKCVDDNYSEKLKLANFLPNIKQSDFLSDFIKSNNLFFNIDNNNITLKTRGDSYTNRSQLDLTDRVSSETISITPINLNTNYQLGLSSSTRDDFKTFVDTRNPVITYQLGNNIYLTNTTIDLTSKYFKAGYDRPFYYRKYGVNWSGRFGLNESYNQYGDILLPSFSEGGDYTVALNAANTNYGRENRLIYENGLLPIDIGVPNVTFDMLVNSIPFRFVRLRSAVSNKGWLLNENKRSLLIDNFTDLSNSSYVELMMWIDDNIYSVIDLTKPITLQNSIYYIQSINAYNPLNSNLTKVKLLRL